MNTLRAIARAIKTPPGEWVRCVDNGHVNAIKLTVGKLYKVIPCKDSQCIRVVNDEGDEQEYYEHRFEFV